MKFSHLVSAGVVATCLAWPVLSQERLESPRSTVLVAQKAKTTKTADKQPSTRLPNGFGKLELSDLQKEKMREVMGHYNAQIDELEAKMTVLKEKRDADVQSLLTAPQKKKLAALESESKSNKKKSEKPSDD